MRDRRIDEKHVAIGIKNAFYDLQRANALVARKGMEGRVETVDHARKASAAVRASALHLPRLGHASIAAVREFARAACCCSA